ncbi:MAG: hypothetical protein AB1793_05300 [Candidatus Thermoplasmatota archaeon]
MTARSDESPVRVRLLATTPSDGNSGREVIDESYSSRVASLTLMAGPSSAESAVMRTEPLTYAARSSAERGSIELSSRMSAPPPWTVM